MRIALKLTGALVATAGVTFAGYARVQLAQEARDLTGAVERETRLLLRSLQVSVENALRDGQLGDVEETLTRLDMVDHGLDVHLFDATDAPHASPLAASPGRAHLEVVRASREAGQLVVRFVPAGAPSRVIAAAPLSDDEGGPLGTLVIERPLLDLQVDLAETERSTYWAVLAVMGATGAVVLALTSLWITRPLGELRAAMRRVEDGDLRTPLPDRSPDEVGALARAFNHMQVELGQALARLEEEGESRRQLLAALREADKLASIGQLSAGLAHEIGSPLQILIGRARLLLERASDPAQTARQARLIVEQGERITRIVEQLLRFARRRPTRKAPTDLVASCRAVVDLLEVEARRRGISLDLGVAPRLPRVLGQDDQMQQIVLNLATNALAATPAGGRVSVMLEHLEADPGVVRLTVADTGRGIPPDLLSRVFEPFFTTRGEEGGTGLGLAVVQGLVTDHDGTLTVESHVGEGTRFVVRLPVAAAVATDSSAEGP